MPYSFRNRNEIRAPSRLDDPEDEHRRASYREPDIDEEVYRSSPPKFTIKYRGPITHFNPNLPPAAFPTLDDLELVRYRPPQTIETESSSSELSIAESPQAGRNIQTSGNGRTSRFPTEDPPPRICQNPTSYRATASNPAKFTRKTSASDHSSRRSMGKDWSWLRGLRPQHDGTAESILEDNQRRMNAAGKLTSFDRNMLEMMSSDDEGEEDAHQQSGKEIHWDDLTTGLKLQLYDLVSGAYSSGEATQKLQLNDKQVAELADFVLTRNERLRREDDEGSRHRRELHERLLRGGRVSEGKFRELVNVNLFQHVREEENDGEYYDNGFLSQAAEVEKARLYLARCGLTSKLLDGAWVSIPEATTAALGGAKGDGSLFPAPLRDLAALSGGRNASQSTPTQHHPPNNNPYDASDYSRSPTKDPRLQARQRTPPSIQRSLHIQRDHSQGRQSSGFIRPSTELGISTVAQQRMPPIGDFVHRPDLARIEIIKARKAAIEANRAAINRQVNKATSKDKARGRKAVPSPRRDRGLKRRTSNDSETSFLTNERRPGARQPKLTEKAVDAEAASQLQSTATVRKKKRTSDGSTKKDTASEGNLTPKTKKAGRQANGGKVGASQTTPQKSTGPDDGTQEPATLESTSCAMMRKDSAIDLTADNDDDDDDDDRDELA